MQDIKQLNKILKGLSSIYQSSFGISSEITKEQWDFINSTYYYINSYMNLYPYSKNHYIEDLKDGSGRSSFKKRTKSLSFKLHKSNFKKKKILSEKEQLKRDWRNKKKDRRDQHTKRYRYRSIERNQNRSERRRSKELLKKGDWKSYEDKLAYKEWDSNNDQGFRYNYPPNEWDDYIVENTEIIKLNKWVTCYW